VIYVGEFCLGSMQSFLEMIDVVIYSTVTDTLSTLLHRSNFLLQQTDVLKQHITTSPLSIHSQWNGKISISFQANFH